MIKKFLVLSFSLFGWTGSVSFAQSQLYALDTVQVIEITFPNSNWDYMLDTAKLGSEGYVLATEVKINGTIFDSCGVRFKGNSSYDSSRVKNPFHIKLDYIHSGYDYNGYEDLKLSNGYSDPSSIREVLAYRILRNYMDAPLSNFAAVYVNGIYYGIYCSSQDIGSDFLSAHFYSSDNTFIKANPENVLNGHIPNLVYLGTDSTQYYDRYELKSDFGWQELIDLCDTLANASSHLDSILDIDRAIWMLAFNNILVNLDSYSGSFAQNYYLYRDDNHRFIPVVWDVNMAFGAFTLTGTSNLNVTGMQQMSPLLHSSNAARPLIQKLLSEPFYQRMYIAHIRTMLNEYFANGDYSILAQEQMDLIDSFVQAESYSLYTYSQFQNSLTTTYGNVPGITQLMDTRASWLQSQSIFQLSTPTISSVQSNPVTINYLDTIWINCTVSNTTAVYLGYRANSYNRFYRVAMYDDGNHGDGAASDGVYGAWILAHSPLMHYYIYADNGNAGIFSPERAEHEYYTVNVASSAAAAGDIVINEFMPSNQFYTEDDNGENEDWIELYNTTSDAKSLFGLYLSDDYSNPNKFALPNVILPANGYIVVWADEDASSNAYIHANFKLSGGGEQLMLSNATGIVLDSISYGTMNADVSLGRCPNGSGSFIQTLAPSIESYNLCYVGIENGGNYTVSVFPNPATSLLTVSCNDPHVKTIQLFDLQGKLVMTKIVTEGSTTLSISNLESGMYFLQLLDENGARVYQGKCIKG